MIGAETVFFSEDTKIGKNVTINPYVVIGSKVKIGNNVTINSFSHLENCKIENKVDFFQTYLDDNKNFDVVVQKGISTKRIDKGCLILNTHYFVRIIKYFFCFVQF